MKLSSLFYNRPRLLSGLLVGGLLGFALPTGLQIPVRAVLAWDTSALTYLILVFIMMAGGEAHEKLKRSATREDKSRWIILILMSMASFASVIAIGTLMHGSKDLPASVTDFHLGLAAATILLSWSLIHMLFAVHYAHEYYGDADSDPDNYSVRGGLGFPDTDQPVFWDFFYYSFVVGMTCQVSDVQVTKPGMRRVTIAHGILTFFFNTVIVALSVNIGAGLIS